MYPEDWGGDDLVYNEAMFTVFEKWLYLEDSVSSTDAFEIWRYWKIVEA